MNERSWRPAPDDWPTALPSPESRDLPRAALAWLYETMPTDRWLHAVLRDQPWTLAVMGTWRIDREIEIHRASRRYVADTWPDVLGPEVMAQLLAAHDDEAERLTVLGRQLRAVETVLFQGGNRPW
ncbi:hypothetical protein EDD99_7249 [Streptomyces sp. 846.5]|nr:hypothetical protein [Streptomyces sp. 846.5]TDT95419.1 hypothetical protein EDD99_7249 [Streptomyces sp. 846.5]